MVAAAWPQGYTLGTQNLTLYAAADSTYTGSGGTGATNALDATVPSPRQTAGSIKSTGPTVGSSYVQWLKNVDPVQSPKAYAGLGVWVRPALTAGTGQTDTVTVLVYFGSTPGDTTGGYASFTAAVASAVPSEWYFISCPWSSLTYAGGASSASWTTGTITRVLQQRYGQANEQPYWIGGIELVARARPKLLLIADGGYISQLNHMRGHINSRGLKVSLAVPWHALGNSGVTMAETDLDTFVADGHDLMLHSYAAAVGYDDTTQFPTQDSVEEDIRAGQQKVRDHGGRGERFLAYPYVNPIGRGFFNDVLDSCGIVFARLGSEVPSGYQNGITTNIYQDVSRISHRRMVYARQLANTLTVANAIADVDQAIRLGSTAVQYIHQTAGAGSAGVWSEANFESYLDGVQSLVKQGLIDCVTVSGWHTGLTQPALVAR